MTVNVKELTQELAMVEQDRYVVLKDSHSGLVHTLEFLFEETAHILGHQDFRCGPHNLDYRGDPEKNGRILHIGQQSWYRNYPSTPDVQTVDRLLAELRNRDPELVAVITHHFDDLCDPDRIIPHDDMSSPRLWGNPGSNARAWPTDCRKSPPDRVLLISNRENEAYSRLVRARNRELDTTVEEMQSRRPTYRDLDELPRNGRQTTPRKHLEDERKNAALETREAKRKYALALGTMRK